MKTCERCEHCHTAGAEWCRCPCHPDTSHKCPPYYTQPWTNPTTPNIPWTNPVWTVQHSVTCCNGNNPNVKIY